MPKAEHGDFGPKHHAQFIFKVVLALTKTRTLHRPTFRRTRQVEPERTSSHMNDERDEE